VGHPDLVMICTVRFLAEEGVLERVHVGSVASLVLRVELVELVGREWVGAKKRGEERD
jgi:hypothetical protein